MSACGARTLRGELQLKLSLLALDQRDSAVKAVNREFSSDGMAHVYMPRVGMAHVHVSTGPIEDGVKHEPFSFLGSFDFHPTEVIKEQIS